MHDGSIRSLAALVDHYNIIVPNPANTNLDRQLAGQNLQLDQSKKDALIAFLKTLTGSRIYTDKKWADPFEPNGNLNLIPLAAAVEQHAAFEAVLYPNPAVARVNIQLPAGKYLLEIYDAAGRKLKTQQIAAAQSIDLSHFPNGLLQFRITDQSSRLSILKLVSRAGG
jgi:cytochrome c peroxidase